MSDNTDESCLEHGKWKHAAGIYQKRTDGSSTLKNILIKMALDMKDLDPEYCKVCDKYFWLLA